MAYRAPQSRLIAVCGDGKRLVQPLSTVSGK